ncbi:MAG: Concanavalin A-like lectin/glucanases superfamily protein, LamG domain [Candidatus Fermentimicrarchaeum limneticum]|uniref:Concanavalin A-like lectin/glucanases superfamily protein, LamG domain n=1 Tax=Fermentimicrarchaeum limneticum TaxID=2795018 RepID=A0A7D6BF59_FERL1|nr:MAG: Concanavalin A-like lectin/glucanases superfamily protein, LamG domain [Candidatus Fermentimicrarchaeum limneticum]QLJ52577.1 MAG: Concanavalin A-like lectin/glucanases superfamily protein, LamG domain [Candidatus Fermentimicrarchaeum limneticum]QLJ52614.1 MAG: Concanavalin A-like lectin/glucanases superfamily protein, LamG domain [Candidatus Fermentimicrarchaeum limneticum]
MSNIANSLITLLMLVSVASASYVCSRTAITDTYCNDDGSRTAVLYSYQPNVLTEGGWQPFEDVASLEYRDDHFELSYNGQTVRIDLFAVVDGKETATKDTELMVEPVIIKQRGGFEYGVILDNADKVEALGFRIGGDEIKGIVYDFSDTVTDKTSLEMLDSKTALVRNINATKQLTIDPLIILNESNSGNLADTFVNGSATTTNYGTLTSMQVAYVTTASRIFMLWDVPTGSTFTTVTNAQLILNASTVGGAVSHQCYNTSNAWTETGLTWDTQPSANTLQSATTLAGVGVYNWTVTDAVNACMKQANTNCSLMVKLTTESGSQANYFYTKENALVTARPQLNITYTNSYTFPETGLVGYWKFDEGIGSNTVDSSGSENSGTISGASWTTSKYRMNSTLNYDGVNQQVSGSFSPTTTTMNFTVSGWIYPTSQTGVIFGLYNASTSWVIYLNTGRDLSVYNGSVDIFSKWFYPPLYTWTHIAIVYDGSYISGYENGVLIGSTAFSTLKTPTTPTFYLGTTPTFTTDYTGTIDEVKIWNRTLSASEVMSEYLKNGCLYSMNISCFNESSTSQQIYYDLILSNTTASQTFDDMWNWTSNQYCNGSTPMNSVTASISNDSFYSPRNYYVGTASSPNVMAYLLPLNDPYPILSNIQIISSSGYAIQNALVTVQKQISGTWVTIAQKYTDATGVAGFNLDYQTQYLLVVNATGYPVAYWPVTPTSQTYQIFLTPSAQTGLSQIFSQISSGCMVDNSSYPTSVNISCSANDSSGQLQSVNLFVRSLGTYGSATICDVDDDTANFTLNCTVSSPMNQTVTYTLIGHTSSTYGVLIQGSFNFGSQAVYNNGLFPAFLLSLALGLLGVFINPSLGIALFGSGWLLSAIMGLIYIPPIGIGALIVICGLLIYVLRT